MRKLLKSHPKLIRAGYGVAHKVGDSSQVLFEQLCLWGFCLSNIDDLGLGGLRLCRVPIRGEKNRRKERRC